MALDELGRFMASIRRQESGSYAGVYSAIGRPVVVNGVNTVARGAYQILSINWDSWARQAGLPGASWRDPRAQDAVARHKMVEYYNRYRNWEAVMVAWYAGPGRVSSWMSGKISRSSTLGKDINRYVSAVKGHFASYQGGGQESLESEAKRRFLENEGKVRGGAAIPPGLADDGEGAAPWYYPVYLDPMDSLAAFFAATETPDEEPEGPSAGAALGRILTSLSRSARGGEDSPVGSPGDLDEIDLLAQTPAIEAED